MDYTQIDREVRWTLWLSFLYLIGWVSFAYFSPSGKGLLGFPIWFELACVYLPCLFTLLVWAVIKCLFKEISLEGDKQ